MVSKKEIEEKRTKNGGWTRETLASWGVPWPPPKGWKLKLSRIKCPECGNPKCVDRGLDEYDCPTCGSFWGMY